jgi:glycosyltransferase involved in cell wall biosynthesis
MALSIDVVIPSFRLLTDTLLPILNLQYPTDTDVRFYLIADNPEIIPDDAITALVDNKKTFLLINPLNSGASKTRNNGIEAGTGDWILFLDDDIKVTPGLLFTYAEAIKQNPDEIGFIGLVNMPPAPTRFATAVNINGSMSIFGIAKQQEYFAWGATANIMVNRRAMRGVRFSDAYPKTGGGEEVEFFFRVREANNFKDYKCIPGAAVTHPWWGGGKTDFMRFYRYGKGNSFLPQRNPKYRAHDFLNTPETLLIVALLYIILLFTDRNRSVYVLYFIALTLVLDYLVNVLRVYKADKTFSPLLALNVMLLRISVEKGALVSHLSRFRLVGIGERFHYNGQTKAANYVLNTYKIIKLAVYLAAIIYAATRIL